VKTVLVWTTQIAQHRFVKSNGVFLLDTTAKSGLLALAPDFRAVMAYKRGDLSEAEYTALYEAKMEKSRKVYDYVWKSLLAPPNRRIAIACYCPKGVFCHRHLFLKMLQTYYKEHNRELIYMGELWNYKAKRSS
jgi:hypothetical protein